MEPQSPTHATSSHQHVQPTTTTTHGTPFIPPHAGRVDALVTVPAVPAALLPLLPCPCWRRWPPALPPPPHPITTYTPPARPNTTSPPPTDPRPGADTNAAAGEAKAGGG